MGLNRNRTRTLWLHQAKQQRMAEGTAPFFETEAVALTGTLQPLEGKTAAEVYGEESLQTALLLTEEKLELKEGAGVALGAEEACRFRIAAPPECWATHQRAILKSI